MTGKNAEKRKMICLAAGLAAVFVTADLFGGTTTVTPRLISADFQQTNGPLDTMFNFCVGAGRANEGLHAVLGGNTCSVTSW